METLKDLAIKIKGAPCSLWDCPPGLFLFGDILGYKSDNNYNDGFVDAYCFDTGESFWGGSKSREAQGQLQVQPLEYASEDPIDRLLKITSNLYEQGEFEKKYDRAVWILRKTLDIINSENVLSSIEQEKLHNRLKSFFSDSSVNSDENKVKNDSFVQGYICAAATLMRCHGEDSLARDIITQGGFGVKDILCENIDQYDKDALAPIIDELRRKGE